jgi:hypothetical protein
MAKPKKKPAAIVEFEKRSRMFLGTHEGPAIGVLHMGFIASGVSGVPFQKDVPLPANLIPKGTTAIELVNVVAVLQFEDAQSMPIAVPIAELQTWAWCAKNAAGKWYSRIHVEFQNKSAKFGWWVGLNQSFFFFG